MVLSGCSIVLLACTLLVPTPGRTQKTFYGQLVSGVYMKTRVFSSTLCQSLCWYSASCMSCSWAPRTGLCSLSSETMDTSPASFFVSPHYIYSDVMHPHGMNSHHPCISRPCDAGEICIPVEAATSKLCLNAGMMAPSSTPVTTTMGTTSVEQTSGSTSATPEPLSTTVSNSTTSEPLTIASTTSGPLTITSTTSEPFSITSSTSTTSESLTTTTTAESLTTNSTTPGPLSTTSSPSSTSEPLTTTSTTSGPLTINSTTSEPFSTTSSPTTTSESLTTTTTAAESGSTASTTAEPLSTMSSPSTTTSALEPVSSTSATSETLTTPLPTQTTLIFTSTTSETTTTTSTTTTTTTTTTAAAQTNACVSDCGSLIGRHHSCKGCHMYAVCAVGVLTDMPCPTGTEWNNILKTCVNAPSPTCP